MHEPTEGRYFTLLDALVLIAATAAGLGLTRDFGAIQAITSMEVVNLWTGPGIASGRTTANATYYTELYGSDLSRHWYGLAAYWTQRIALWPCPSLLSLSVAVGIIALVRPRSGPLVQPGLVAAIACIAASLAVGLALPQTLIGYPNPAIGWTLYWRQWWVATCFVLPRAAALAVSISWLTLALSGRWQADRNWLDRLGRFLGVCWILLGAVRVLSSWLAVFVG